MKHKEIMEKKQKEFKDKVINEFVKNTSRNKYTKCKRLDVENCRLHSK